MFKNLFSSIPWTLSIAVRYISDRKRERWISISAILTACGLTLGVAVLIIILSVMQGFRDSMLEKMLGINGHVAIFANLTQEELLELKKLPEVKSAVRMIQKQVMMTVQKPNQTPQMFGVIIRAMPAIDLEIFLNQYIKTGSMKDLIDYKGMSLGGRIAQEYNIKVGESIKITPPDQISTPFGDGIPTLELPVSSTFAFGMNYYDSSFCFMTKEAFTELNLPAIEPVFIFLHDPYNSKLVKTKLKNHRYSDYIVDWQESDITFVQVLTVQRNVMFIVISLMVLIAAFNGVSSLFMLVKEKSKEIAIMRVLGASKTDIRNIFLYIGLMMSGISIVLGAILGVFFSLSLDSIRMFIEKFFGVDLFPADFYQMTKIPVYLDVWQILVVSFWCLLLIMLVLLYPIKKSMKIDPDYELREL